MNDYQDLWNEIRTELEKKIQQAAFEKYFKNTTKVLKSENGLIYVGVESPFVRSHINNIYYNMVHDILKTKSDKNLKIKFVTKEEIKEKDKDKPVQTKEARPTNFYLNPNYSFESYVPGESNRQAFLAASKVAENPKQGLFNPLYIFGGVGLGKTHLMQAIGNYIADYNVDAKIVYVQANDFVTDYSRASSAKDFTAFDAKYDNIDVLLIDDIQFLSDRVGSQQQFFNLFNTLTNRNAQIVITSDCPADKLQKFMSRLTSRFANGLIVDIHQPDFNQRLNILKKKAIERTEKPIPDSVLSYIAEKFTDNVRILEGALNRVIQFSDFENAEINLENSKIWLSGIIVNKKEESNYEKCLSVIAGMYDIDISEIIGVSRKAKITLARQMAMYIMRTKYDMKYDAIGQILNGRDHSTVMNGYNKIEDGIKTNSEIKMAYEAILKKL